MIVKEPFVKDCFVFYPNIEGWTCVRPDDTDKTAEQFLSEGAIVVARRSRKRGFSYIVNSGESFARLDRCVLTFPSV
jgi:hypothetical protein